MGPVVMVMGAGKRVRNRLWLRPADGRSRRVPEMRQAFAFAKVAVLVFPWYEPGGEERGARVEVRLLADQRHRGSRSAAQRVVIDQPVFRADLFDRTDAPPGNLRSADFHPTFDGIEPCERNWPDELRRDPTGWLQRELNDLPHLLERSGVRCDGASWLARDAAALRNSLPAIVHAVERVWEDVRAG